MPSLRLLLQPTGPMAAASSTSADTRAGPSRRSPNTTANTLAGSAATHPAFGSGRRSRGSFASRPNRRKLTPGARSSDAGEELQHSLGQQRGRVRVVGGQRVVGEIVLVAGVEEQLGVVHLLDDLARRLHVSLADEDRVIVHAVDLDGDAIWPGSEGPLAADGDGRVEEERASRSGPGLGQLLRDHLTEREPGIHEVLRQVVRGAFALLDHLVHAAGLYVGHSLVDAPEGATLEQVRRVHGVARMSQILRERLHA